MCGNGEFEMTCKCNCHDPSYRKANDISEHKTCMECAFALAEEEARYLEREKELKRFLEQKLDDLPPRYAQIVNDKFWELI
jgi:hypothetical protein